MNHLSLSPRQPSNPVNNSSIRLQGRWLFLARGSWVVVVTFGLVVALSGFVDPKSFCGQTLCSVVDFSGGILPGLVFVLPAVIWIVVGGVLFVLKSDNRVVWLMSLALVIVGVCFLTDNLIFDANSQIIHGQLTWQFSPYFLYLLKTELILLSLALFPNGRFIPKWTRWVTFVFPIYILLYFLVPALHRWAIVDNPINDVLWWGCEGSLIVAQIYRYVRRSESVERQQIKWIVFSFIVIILADVLNTYLPAFPSIPHLRTIITSILTFSILIVPISVAIALLRYRLWEIDIIINRTLVYGTLTAILTLIYVGSIFLCQSLLRGFIHQDNEVAIVVSTLVIAALFQPLRHHIQAMIDRRFYRRKYDAAKVVAAFSIALRQEVDLEQLREQLVAVVQETMQPTHVSLWLQPTEQATKQQVLSNSNPQEK